LKPYSSRPYGAVAMSDSALELDELPYLVGRAWKLGDGVRAEQILSPEHADKQLGAGEFVLRGVVPAPVLQAGDFLVAGLGFGSGAATRATARALRLVGAGAVIARSFGDAFLRCALHAGLPPLQVEETEAIKSGDRLRVDVEGHKVVNLSSGDRYVIRNIYGEALDVLRAGGMAEYLALRGRA
jgi:3-isopropylmalate/(R)-2-methylmalate dehydratase small subunit